MRTLVLPSPAKLNLFLHILGRRHDGYHELQTLFQLLDYGDEITLHATDDSQIKISPHIKGLPETENLIYKAAQLLKRHTGCEQGAKIYLNKKLPMGGGIAGGSSNAATTLMGLNDLWQCHLTLPELAVLGKQLGADVPVFVGGHSAWAEGVGEQLKPLNLPLKWYLVLAPNCHVSTSLIFSHKDLTRDNLPITVAAFLDRGGANDCQKLVESLYPQVRNAVEWLSQFSHAQMTGTGACVFASFHSKEAAEAVLAQRPEQFNGFVAKGVNRSPLHEHLSSISIAD